MQTFLPYPDFRESAAALDTKRLGKQRVEVMQLLNALSGASSGWSNHPAARMWRGHRGSLVLYGYAVCDVWRERGYKDTVREKLELTSRGLPVSEARAPSWLGNDAFHASHRSNLLRKDPNHYGKFGWREKSDLEYVWPTPTGEREVKTIYRGYDIETDADGKITGVAKDGGPVEKTFDGLLTAEAVMKKIDGLTSKKTKEAEASAAYDKSAEYDWSALDEKTLRNIYAQMQASGNAKLADLAPDMKIEELRTTCKNVHNYFRVRSTEAKVTNQQTKAKKAATKQETDTMAKTAKKTAKTTKKTAKKATSSATPKVEKFAGYPLDAKVTVLNQKNPAREGGAKYKRWEVILSKSHKTIADLKKAKANPGTVRNAVKAKSIKVTV